MAELFKAQGRVFFQDEEYSPFELLTCTGAGDITIPAGDETPVYCPDPAEVGKFVVTGSVEGEAGFVTYSLIRPLQSTVNYLLTELHDCRFHARVNWSVKGTVPSIVTDYLAAIHLHRSRVSSRTVNQPAIITPDENERVDTNAELNAWDWRLVYPNTSTRIAQVETNPINGIAFDMSSECNVYEIGGDQIAKDGYFTTDHTSTSAAVSPDVWYTTDYGVTWTECATDPFAGGEDAGPVVTLGGRVITGRLDTDAGAPAEVAISDDYGATWANVNVGTTNGQTMHGLAWIDWTHLWACTSGGYVYFSDDAGLTWTTQTAGVVTAQNLMDLWAYDRENVWASGAAGALIRTTDGENWELVAGPAAVADQFNTVFMRSPNLVLIGSNAGNVYRTADAGTTWSAALAVPQWASGEVMRIRGEIALDYFLYVIGDNSGSVGECYRSEDGGASFYEVDLDANLGLNDLFVVDQNVAWTGGEVQGGTAFLAKIHEVS